MAPTGNISWFENVQKKW